MKETKTDRDYGRELEELLGSDDDPLGTKEYNEMVEKSEEVSEEVEKYLQKAESNTTETRLTNHSTS